MKTATTHFAITPLAACLAAALTLGTVLPAAAIAFPAGARSPARQAHDTPEWNALLPTPSPSLVSSKVTIGDAMVAAGASSLMVNGPNGVGRPNAHPVAESKSSQGASTWVVTNCNDSGSGSLRDIVENVAASGDTVDLSQLSCSEVGTSLAIIANQDSLVLRGPGADQLAIGNVKYDGVIFHYGTGTLFIENLTIADGTRPGGGTNVSATGGCIYSSGNVQLDSSVVTGCHVHVAGSTSFHSLGGGVFAAGGLYMNQSRITDCYIAADSGLRARGGGAYVGGRLAMSNSSIDYNTAAPFGVAGGAWVAGNGGLFGTVIANSSFHGNQAYAVGAILFAAGDPDPNVTISNSTIADNSVAQFIGGIKDYVPLQIYNSTISGNTAGLHINPSNGSPIDSGLYFGYGDLTLQSTILAGNMAAGQPADLSKYSSGLPNISGANNLIFAAHNCVVPTDTMVAVDPLLGDLDPHGGATPTIDLLPGSPAIDAGNNIFAAAYDQRDVGFPRVIGANADIGAFETSPPALFITPVDIDFGPIPIGETGYATVTFTNTGSLQLQITNLSNNLAPPFFRDSGNCGVPPITLAPQASCHVDYRFEPTAAGSFSTAAFIVTDSVGTFQIDLAGSGDNDVIFRNGFEP